jgi:hypothetical protein
VLQFWNQATGHERKGYRLAVYCCKRCGGFHICQQLIEKQRVRPVSLGSHPSQR